MRTPIGKKEIIITFLFSTLLATVNPTNITPFSTSAFHDVRSDAAISQTDIVYQYQNVTHEGDFVISGNETFTIEDSEFHMKGKITLNETSTLIIKDSKFFTIPSWTGESIVLMNQARLVVTNSSVIFQRPSFASEIRAWDDARINITYSTTQGHGYAVAHNNSAIYVNNSTIATSTTMNSLELSGVATFDASTSTVENSTMDGAFVWDTSSVSLTNSTIGIVRATAPVNIRNSKIRYIEAWWGNAPAFRIESSTVRDAKFGGSASALFTDSSVSGISASGNATVWLIDCSYGRIETRDNATVFVGWLLPLLGVAVIPHNWIPILQFIIATSIIVMIITVLLVLRRRKKRRIQKEELYTEACNQHTVLFRWILQVSAP